MTEELMAIFNQTLPDLQTVSVAVDVTESQPVTDFAVQVDIRHTFIGDLVVSLLPPTGAAVVLHNRSGGATQNLKRTYNATTTAAERPQSRGGDPPAGAVRTSIGWRKYMAPTTPT